MMNLSERVGAVLAKALAAGVLLASAGLAQALPFSAFEGRNADGSVNTSCAVAGANKCTMIYNKTLNITILNDWNIGGGFWDGSVTPFATSAQGKALTAGEAQTDFTGWRLPTGDGNQPAGSLNEYRSIWNDVGQTLAGLQSEFDGLPTLLSCDTACYWSGSEGTGLPNSVAHDAWMFLIAGGIQSTVFKTSPLLLAVAVRSGDVAPVVPIPEPESLALLLVGLVAAGVTGRRRPF